MATEPTISFKGEQYPVSELPKELQDLISVFKRWEGELSDAKVEVFKLEAALKSISKELDFRFTDFGAKKAALAKLTEPQPTKTPKK